MSEDVGAAITLFTGLMAIRLVVADGYLTYVRRSMGPWLLLAGLALVILAGVRLVRSIGSANDHEPHRPHAHGHAPRVALLLLAPLLAVVLIDPPPLGSFTARRAGPAQRPQEVSSNSGLDPLPAPRGGAVDLSLDAFSQRALYHQGLGLRRTPLRMVGFASPDPGRPSSFLLTRFVLTCCAADASPVQVEVEGADPVPAADQWVEVTGTWRPGTRLIEGADVAGVRAHRLRPIRRPSNPYE